MEIDLGLDANVAGAADNVCVMPGRRLVCISISNRRDQSHFRL